MKAVIGGSFALTRAVLTPTATMPSSTWKASFALLSVLLLADATTAASTLTLGNPQATVDTTNSPAGSFTGTGVAAAPGLRAIVQYEFEATIDVALGPQDSITVTLTEATVTGGTPSATGVTCSYTGATSAVDVPVNLAPDTTKTVGTDLTAGTALTCKISATVGTGDVTAKKLPSFKAAVAYKQGVATTEVGQPVTFDEVAVIDTTLAVTSVASGTGWQVASNSAAGTYSTLADGTNIPGEGATVQYAFRIYTGKALAAANSIIIITVSPAATTAPNCSYTKVDKTTVPVVVNVGSGTTGIGVAAGTIPANSFLDCTFGADVTAGDVTAGKMASRTVAASVTCGTCGTNGLTGKVDLGDLTLAQPPVTAITVSKATPTEWKISTSSPAGSVTDVPGSVPAAKSIGIGAVIEYSLVLNPGKDLASGGSILITPAGTTGATATTCTPTSASPLTLTSGSVTLAAITAATTLTCTVTAPVAAADIAAKSMPAITATVSYTPAGGTIAVVGVVTFVRVPVGPVSKDTPESRVDPNSPVGSFVTAGAVKTPGLRAVVQYSFFAITNTALVIADKMTVTLTPAVANGPIPAVTGAACSFTPLSTTVNVPVNVYPDQTQQVGAPVPAGTVLACKISATVGTADVTANKLPSFKADIAYNPGGTATILGQVSFDEVTVIDTTLAVTSIASGTGWQVASDSIATTYSTLADGTNIPGEGATVQYAFRIYTGRASLVAADKITLTVSPVATTAPTCFYTPTNQEPVPVVVNVGSGTNGIGAAAGTIPTKSFLDCTFGADVTAGDVTAGKMASRTVAASVTCGTCGASGVGTVELGALTLAQPPVTAITVSKATPTEWQISSTSANGSVTAITGSDTKIIGANAIIQYSLVLTPSEGLAIGDKITITPAGVAGATATACTRAVGANLTLASNAVTLGANITKGTALTCTITATVTANDISNTRMPALTATVAYDPNGQVASTDIGVVTFVRVPVGRISKGEPEAIVDTVHSPAGTFLTAQGTITPGLGAVVLYSLQAIISTALVAADNDKLTVTVAPAGVTAVSCSYTPADAADVTVRVNLSPDNTQTVGANVTAGNVLKCTLTATVTSVGGNNLMPAFAATLAYQKKADTTATTIGSVTFAQVPVTDTTSAVVKASPESAVAQADIATKSSTINGKVVPGYGANVLYSFTVYTGAVALPNTAKVSINTSPTTPASTPTCAISTGGAALTVNLNSATSNLSTTASAATVPAKSNLVCNFTATVAAGNLPAYNVTVDYATTKSGTFGRATFAAVPVTLVTVTKPAAEWEVTSPNNTYTGNDTNKVPGLTATVNYLLELKLAAAAANGDVLGITVDRAGVTGMVCTPNAGADKALTVTSATGQSTGTVTLATTMGFAQNVVVTCKLSVTVSKQDVANQNLPAIKAVVNYQPTGGASAPVGEVSYAAVPVTADTTLVAAGSTPWTLDPVYSPKGSYTGTGGVYVPGLFSNVIYSFSIYTGAVSLTAAAGVITVTVTTTTAAWSNNAIGASCLLARAPVVVNLITGSQKVGVDIPARSTLDCFLYTTVRVLDGSKLPAYTITAAYAGRTGGTAAGDFGTETLAAVTAAVGTTAVADRVVPKDPEAAVDKVNSPAASYTPIEGTPGLSAFVLYKFTITTGATDLASADLMTATIGPAGSDVNGVTCSLNGQSVKVNVASGAVGLGAAIPAKSNLACVLNTTVNATYVTAKKMPAYEVTMAYKKGASSSVTLGDKITFAQVDVVNVPCDTCLNCLQDFSSFVKEIAPGDLASAFSTECATKKRSSDRCNLVSQRILAQPNAGLRAGTICQVLGECVAGPISSGCTMTVAPAAETGADVTGSFSKCTKEGVTGGTLLTGFPAAALPTITSGQCFANSDCTTVAGQECKLAAATPLCSCDPDTGNDICKPAGTCGPTACNQCQACLAAANTVATAQLAKYTAADPNAAADAAAVCNAIQTALGASLPTGSCTALATKYPASPPTGSTALFGFRAGAVCLALGQCSQLPGTCRLSATKTGSVTAVQGAFDPCTVQGVAGTDPIGQAVPSGACLKDADCGADKQCDLTDVTVTNKVRVCSLGVDAIKQYGKCILAPVTKTTTSCQRCKDCIAALKANVEAAATATNPTADALATTFYTVCAAVPYGLTACRTVQTAIKGSQDGNLARRAGALCVGLGECNAALSTDTSCVLSVAPTAATPQNQSEFDFPAPPSQPSGGRRRVLQAPALPPGGRTEVARPNITGTLDTCTIEGVSTGGMVSKTYRAAQVIKETCLMDSDCVGNGNKTLCSTDTPVTVCRCLSGVDSCDQLGRCITPPTKTVVTPPTPCQRCQKCLRGISTAAATLTNAATASANFQALCTGTLTNNNLSACKRVADAIFYDNTVAQKAGYLCLRIGECTPDMATSGSDCTMKLQDADTTAKKLNLCSANGLDAYTAPTVSKPYPSCQANTDCAKDANNQAVTGQVCSFDPSVDDVSVTTAITGCTNGEDVRTKYGTCVDFCATQQNYLNAVSEKFKTCNTDADCGGLGKICQASATCKTVTCDSETNTLKTDTCTGFCVVSSRVINSASMSPNGRTITAVLSTSAAPGDFSCATIFNAATMANLGNDARCRVTSEDGQVLVITLGPRSGFLPGQHTLTTAAGQAALVDLLDPSAKFTGANIAVSGCVPGAAGGSGCTPPTAVVTGPADVSPPCGDAPASDVVFDASGSSDVSGRQLTKVTWALGPGQTSDVVLVQAITQANTAKNGAGSFRLAIPAAQLQLLTGEDDTAYKIQATVTNFLGATSNPAVFTFTKRAAGAKPVVALPTGTTVTYKPAEGIRIPVRLDPASACGKKVIYSWTAAGWAAVPAGYAQKDLVIPGPVPDSTGTHTVRFFAKLGDNGDEATTDITLVPQYSPVQAVLKGPRGDVKSGSTIVISAAGSIDPDNPQSTNPLAVTWTCTRSDFPNPCFSGSNTGTQSGLTWTIPGDALTAGIQHTITATVKRTTFDAGTASYLPDTTESMWGTAQLSFTPRAGAIPTGRVRRVCSTNPCPPSHSADQPLVVVLAPDTGAPTFTVAWSSPDIADLTATGRDLSIPANKLPDSGAVTIKAVLTSSDYGSTQTSTTTLTVPINGRPKCTAANNACLSVTGGSATGTFPDAKFPVEAAGFVDDQPTLRYDFGIVSTTGARRVMSSGLTPTYTFTGLSVGPTTVYVCAVDSAGANACSQTTLTVNQPAADFKVADALANIDVTELTNTGDPSVFASGAQALSAAAGFANTANSGQSDADKQAIQRSVAAKAVSMITSFANAANAYANDPQGMSQLVSAVATLTKATNQLSTGAKASMLKVADSGIQAAGINQNSIRPADASGLLALVASGNGVQAPATSAGGGRRLLEVAPEWLNIVMAHGRRLLQSTFTPAYDAQVDQVAALLSSGAGPGDYKTAGDTGIYVTTANSVGSTYADTTLAVGPTPNPANPDAADPASATNAKVKFSAALNGPCVDENGNSVAGTCTNVVVPVTLTYVTDITSALTGAASTAGNHTAASGVVTVDVAGQESGAFPCDGCTAALTIPLSGTQDTTKVYECGTVTNGAITWPTNTSVAGEKASSANPSCTISNAGSYILGSRPATAAQKTNQTTTPAQVVKYSFELKLTNDQLGGMSVKDYLSNDTNKNALAEALKTDMAAQFQKNKIAVTRDQIQIQNLRAGSILFDVILDTTGVEQSQVNSITSFIDNAKLEDVFSPSFIQSYGLTGFKATRITDEPTTASKPIGAIVGGVVGGVGGALLLAAIAFFIHRRRTRGAVEPRSHEGTRGLIGGEHQA